MLSLNDLLREVRILQSPETEHALFQCLSTINVILSVPDSNEIRVCHIDVYAADLAILGVIELELEERFDGCLILRIEILVFLLFLFLLVLFLLLNILLDA